MRGDNQHGARAPAALATKPCSPRALHSASATIRHHLIEARGFDPDLVKAAAYWRQGEADHYDGHTH